jgi:hypothetical protein
MTPKALTKNLIKIRFKFEHEEAAPERLPTRLLHLLILPRHPGAPQRQTFLSEWYEFS